jgi:hypothetical protein
MRKSSMLRRCFTSVTLFAVVAGCSKSEEHKPQAMAEIASGSLAVRANVPATVPSVPALPQKPVIVRPKDAADLIASAEKRARVEAFAPETKGFLTSEAIENELYKLELKRGKDADAVKALDRMARGRWVLFTGNIGAVAKEGCELPIRYTPKDPNDNLGLTSVWVPIRISGIKGYDANEYRPGELAVILARYEGEQKASPGYDLVFLQKWFAP